MRLEVQHVGMEYDQIGEIFQKWASSGELVLNRQPLVSHVVMH